jgi:DNA-binding MarR family transcriptional regulator
MRQPSRDASETYRLDTALDFMRLLWSIEHGLQKRSKRMKAESGITGPQRLVLRIVGRYPGISAGDVARLIELHPSTVTGILQRLAMARLLRREKDPDDSRRVCLRTTPRAAPHVRPSSGPVERIVREVLQGASAEDAAAARALLAELARRLND